MKTFSLDLEGESLPGSPIGVGLFLSELAKSPTSASTINAHFYAMKWAHNLCGLDDPTKHSFPLTMLEAAKRLQSKPVV